MESVTFEANKSRKCGDHVGGTKRSVNVNLKDEYNYVKTLPGR